MKGALHSHSQTVATIRAAIDEAMSAAEVAVQKAIHVGQLLIEAKPGLGHGNFQDWIEDHFPDLSYATAHRWMQAAERTCKALGIEAGALDLPVSRLLGAGADELSERDTVAQQLLLDFTRDKTIKDCLAAVVVEGDEPHRITRAANGRKHGGSRGEDRKDWPKFIDIHLKDILAHLKFWKSFTPAQVETTHVKLDGFIAKLPTPLLTHLKQRITEELKTR